MTPMERLKTMLDCAEGSMQRSGWLRTERGYQWDSGDALPDVHVAVHRGYLLHSGKWIKPHVERVDFNSTPMKHLPRIDCDTLWDCVKAAEAWMAGSDHDWMPEGNHHRCARCNEWHGATPGLEVPPGRPHTRTCDYVRAEQQRAAKPEPTPPDPYPNEMLCTFCGELLSDDDEVAAGACQPCR